MFSIWILVQIGTVPSDYWVGTTGLVPGEYWLDTEIYSVTQLRSIIRIPIPSLYYLDDPWFRLQLYAKLGLLKLRTKLQLFQILVSSYKIWNATFYSFLMNFKLLFPDSYYWIMFVYVVSSTYSILLHLCIYLDYNIIWEFGKYAPNYYLDINSTVGWT